MIQQADLATVQLQEHFPSWTLKESCSWLACIAPVSLHLNL